MAAIRHEARSPATCYGVAPAMRARGDAVDGEERNQRDGPVPDDAAALHRRLSDATPEQRLVHILRLIEGAADACLRLPELQGARLTLPSLRLDADTLRPHVDSADVAPSWWHAESGAARLHGAVLRGASLQDAVLDGVDLTRADLSDSALRSASLRAACLEGASLARADLTGADLAGVRASEADLQDALLEDARFAGAVLRFARLGGALLEHADFTDADLWGARLDSAEMPYATLRRAVAQEASMVGADLSGANLEEADLRKADLSGAKLRGADLRGAVLAGAKLGGADLTDASLPRANLSTCDLRHIRIAGAWLESTRMRVDQLGGALGEEVAGDFDAARQGYLNLEKNFRDLGVPDSASWAYRRARRMGKRHTRALARAALRERRWRDALLAAALTASDSFAEWLCDYGESLPRVLRAFVTILLCFALYYAASGSLLHEVAGPNGPVLRPSRAVGDLLSFSFLEMCTSSTPDIGLHPANRLVFFVGSLQYIVGVVLIGLFGYVLGNRIRR